MHFSRPFALAIIFSTIALGGSSCDGGGGGFSGAGMNVQIFGLASNSDANVVVAGPAGSQVVTTSRTLSLSPGQYVITAGQVLTGQFVMQPTMLIQTVTLTANQVMTVNVSYNTLRPLALRLAPVANLSGQLVQPIFLASPPDTTGRIFVAERPGRIRIFDPNTNTLLPTPFLDLNNPTVRVSTDGERGLLSFAFDPRFAQPGNGFFYVHFTDLNGDIIVERYQVSADPNVANSITRTPVITIQHRAANNHNGGTIAFGPDSFLWISTGDGGGANDQFQNAQNTAPRLGKMLRVHVSGLPAVSFPPDNPFTDQAVWAIGLRNPFR